MLERSMDLAVAAQSVERVAKLRGAEWATGALRALARDGRAGCEGRRVVSDDSGVGPVAALLSLHEPGLKGYAMVVADGRLSEAERFGAVADTNRVLRV